MGQLRRGVTADSTPQFPCLHMHTTRHNLLSGRLTYCCSAMQYFYVVGPLRSFAPSHRLSINRALGIHKAISHCLLALAPFGYEKQHEGHIAPWWWMERFCIKQQFCDLAHRAVHYFSTGLFLLTHPCTETSSTTKASSWKDHRWGYAKGSNLPVWWWKQQCKKYIF